MESGIVGTQDIGDQAADGDGWMKEDRRKDNRRKADEDLAAEKKAKKKAAKAQAKEDKEKAEQVEAAKRETAEVDAIKKEDAERRKRGAWNFGRGVAMVALSLALWRLFVLLTWWAGGQFFGSSAEGSNSPSNLGALLLNFFKTIDGVELYPWATVLLLVIALWVAARTLYPER